jgi:hypothetical protein
MQGYMAPFVNQIVRGREFHGALKNRLRPRNIEIPEVLLDGGGIDLTLERRNTEEGLQLRRAKSRHAGIIERQSILSRARINRRASSHKHSNIPRPRRPFFAYSSYKWTNVSVSLA